MKKLVALLLTLSLLLGMAGTAAVAADASSSTAIPELTATVDSAGNVTAKLANGDKDFDSVYAYVYPKDGGYSEDVRLEYDSTKGAFVGKDEEVAGGSISSVNFYKSKTSPDNTKYTRKSYYYYYEGSKTVFSARAELENTTRKKVEYEVTDSSGEKHKSTTFVPVSGTRENLNQSFANNTKILSYESHNTTTYSGDEKNRKAVTTYESKNYNSETGKVTNESTSTTTDEQVGKVIDRTYYSKYDFLTKSSTSTSETKSYDYQYGVYTGKSNGESESKYDTSGNEALETEKTESRKGYNEDGVLTSELKGSGTTSYSSDKKSNTYKYSSVSKEYSNKGYLKNTEKYNTTSESAFNTKTNRTEVKKTNTDKTTTNRDGAVSYTYNYNKTKGDESAYTEKWTTKNYNTYTSAVTDMTEGETEQYKNTTTNNWDSKTTITNTYNNDDGSLRRKIVTYNYDGKEEGKAEETHYNSANSVAAKKVVDTKKKTVTEQDSYGNYTYVKEDSVTTWTDGSGNVLGKIEYDEKTGEQKSNIYNVSFKNRTGALDSWTTWTTTTDTQGNETNTTTYYDEGKKEYDSVWSYKADGSYEYRSKGVLRRSYDAEKKEYKYYDIKGTLSSSNKRDNEAKAWMYYNYAGKLIRKEADTDKDGNRIVTYYDPATGKVEKSTKSYYDKDTKASVKEYRNADEKVQYSTKDFYDETLKTSVTGYYDANGSEFARTYSTSDDDKDTNQYIYDGEKWDPENASGAIEKTVASTEEEYRKRTDTTDYTKWTITNGKESDTRTRTDKSVSTWDNNKSEYSTYVGGTLTYNSVRENNDYDKTGKTTAKHYNWYDGKMTGMDKWIYSETDDDPNSYYKRYDKYSNLQEYSWSDDTDEWDWTYNYYADGSFKGESWEDRLDGVYYGENEYGYDYYEGDSRYYSQYYLNGVLKSEESYTGHGKNENGRTVSYNKDGSYRYWADTVNGVTNAWEYDKYGILTGYRWNQKSEDGVSSYEWWDANGALVYNYSEASLADGWTVTKTDASGNKWERKSNGDDTTITLTLANKGSGWQSAVGEWFYVENGKPVTEAWKKVDGSWYYFNANGEMVTSLITIQDEKDEDKYTTYAANWDGTLGYGWTLMNYGEENYGWAYTNANGEVLTGWQNLDGNWYYFTDGWNLNTDETQYKEDVEWKQSGWRGNMVTGATKIWNSSWTDKHTYFFNEDGTWDNSPGWKVADNFYDIEYHYYDKKGNEVTGWNLIDGQWYYFNEDGVMKNGWVKSGPNWYYLDPQKGGAMAKDGWAEDVYEGWYYMDKNGNYKTGWLNDSGNWYYLKSDGAMAENEWAKSGSSWYFMGKDGSMQTGWVKDHDKWYHTDGTGAMEASKWIGSGNTWYYLDADGAMATDTDVTIGGTTYHFDENGVCTNPY